MNSPSGSATIVLFGVVALFVGSIAGGLVYHLSGAADLALSATALLVTLGLGTIVFFREQAVQYKFEEVAGIRGEIRRLRLEFDKLSTRVSELEDISEPIPEAAPRPLIDEIQELRRVLGEFAAEHGVKPPAQASPPTRTAAQPPLQPLAAPAAKAGATRVLQTPPKPELPQVSALGHSIELYLEPIVTLATGRTCHYRAAMALATPDGRHVPYEQLAHGLRNHALRPALDGHCLARVLPLTRKLAIRRQNTVIFVPVGGETLANFGAMRQLASLLESDEGFAPSIVFEIEQKIMGGLAAEGVEGLAALAGQGAAMGLANASSQGIDLAALRDLHFAFISFPASDLPKTVFGKPDWANLATSAGEQEFTIEVRGLINGEQAERAKKWATLGSGPAFAPPRRVRTHDTLSSISAAA